MFEKTGGGRIEAARADDETAAVALIQATSPEMFDAFYAGDGTAMRRHLGAQWRQADGLFSHAHARAARRNDAMIGLELGYPAAEQAAQAAATRAYFAAQADAALRAHIRVLVPPLRYLMPPVPPDAYYLQNLAVDAAARGSGLGALLFHGALERAAGAGCKSCHLDVAAEAPAVGFYLRMGMAVVVETRVPALAESHGIPAHLRMAIDL